MAKEAQNDTVFREEQNHLDSTKAAIQSLLDGYEQRVHKGEKELSSSNRYNDKEDRSSLQNVRSDIYENSSRVAFYKRIIPQPYFGRIDVVENNDKAETETYYVGNDAVLDEDADVLVLSWKDPMGSIFYANTQNNIQVKDTTFQLLLRRALEIQNGTLLSYHTEYDAESSDSLNGEIVDSFLLTVLKDKRRQKQLTNIIRTIQANQNKIIRKPQSDNLVVQGCAGSGKTMILLHRLSVLAYNNREWDLSRVKIITPNRTFNTHINALSEELGLSNIERCSVEEYYISLIHQFNKAVETGTEVHSEMLLDNKFLEEVYSLDFMDKIRLDYEKYWQSMIQELQVKRFAELCTICGVESPVLNTYKNATVEALKGTIERAKERAEQQNQAVENLQARIDEIKKKLNSNQNSTASLNAVLAKRRSLAGDAIQQNIQAMDAQIEKQKNLPTESERSQKLRKDIADIQRLKGKVERAQKEIDDKIEQYLDYDEIHMLSDSFAAQIIDQNQKVESAIQAAEAALKRVPFYNFAKRNALKADIAQLKEKFTAQAQAYIETYKASRTDAIKTATAKQAELEKALAEELQRAGENKKAIADLQHRKDVLLLQQKALPLASYAAWRNAVGNNFEVEEVKDYDKALSEYADAEKAIVTLRETLQMREAELQQSEAHSLNEAQLRDLADCADLAKQLEWQSIINNVLNKDLADLHIKYGVSRRVTNYRFKLYLRLLCCALYYRPIAKPDNFLCVDEAQDISVAEYHLLRSILGERCVFNLYGDINQKIYPYKGVSTWEDIADITGVHDILSEAEMSLDDTTHVCLLNENYRNTLQITEFCNKEFEANVTAVGIAGDPVQEMQLAAAVQWLWGLKRKNKELRVAVVYKPGSKDFRAQMDALPQTTTACWDTVDTDKMCILPVELVKGLEFDAVVAVVDRMSFNEKYVTFTRALDYLSVVRESFRVDDAEDKGSGKKSSDSPAVQAKPSPKAPTEEQIAIEPVQGATPEEESVPEAQPNQEENTSPESAKTDAFYAWLAAQVPEEQLSQMQEMLDSVSEFCKKTQILDTPITEISNAEIVQRVKKHIRSNRVFLTANRMRMPLIFKAMDLLAKYCDLPPVEQKPVQEPETKPETSATPAESAPAPEMAMEKPQNELLQLLPQEELQPLLQAMAADGVTTKKAFAAAMVVGYINRCGYGTRRRIFIWDAIKPVWNAWRRGDSGEEELARVSDVLQGESISTAISGADKEATRINFPNPVSVTPITGSAREQEPAQQAPMRQTLSDETKARIAAYVKKKELAGASLIELTNFTHLSRDEISHYMDSDTAYIEITRELYLHRDCIYDLDDIVEPLENILQKQFRHFYGFTMDKKLKEGADQELSMFINDYDFHTKEEIYGLAKYLFGKCKVNGIEHGFNGNGYIWEKPTKAESNRTAIIINLARRYEDPVLTREEITTQFELLGFFVTMYKQAMGLGPDSPFLQYDTDKFVLAERMKMDAVWAAQVGDALDRLMATVQSDYVVLRAIREDWYDANLPVLPEGVRWTALLLQEVVEHFLQGRYRTVHQYSGLSSDSLCAAIAKADSPLVTFSDIVYNYVEHSALGKADFACEEFRQKLVQAGMLQGAELRTTLPKALDDHRFAWDTAKENLHIVGV